MKLYPESALRRAMKVLEVILKAMAREIKWIQAADILGVTPRTIRRLRLDYQEQGIDGLKDRRRGRPSPRRGPFNLVEKVLCLYAEKYFDFNVKHFHSYTWTKNLLPEAGYVKRARGEAATASGVCSGPYVDRWCIWTAVSPSGWPCDRGENRPWC